MAKRVKKANEVDYIASTLSISYTIPKGLVFMLAKVAKVPEKQVWCMLSEMANVCAHRLSNRKSGNCKSWTTQKFPGTETSLRIDMDKWTPYRYGSTGHSELETVKPTYSARIKISGYTDENLHKLKLMTILQRVSCLETMRKL